MNLTVKLIDPESDYRWDTFVNTHPHGWLFHLSGWKRVLENTFKHMKGYYFCLIDTETNQINAALPLFLVKSLILGNRIVSIPFATLSDPLITFDYELSRFLPYVEKLAAKSKSKYLEIKTCYAAKTMQFDTFIQDSSYVNHFIRLDCSLDHLLQRFHRTSIRQPVKRAIRSDLVIKEGKTIVDLKIFYELYLKNRKRLCLPPQPFIFIANIWKEFGVSEKVKIFLCYKKQTPISGLMIFRFKNRVSAEMSGIDSDFKKWNSNHLLFWHAIEFAHKNGYSLFDFGRTHKKNIGLMQFKQRWGTETAKLLQFYLANEASTRPLYDKKSLSYQLIQLSCKYSSYSTFKRIGNFCYKHLG